MSNEKLLYSRREAAETLNVSVVTIDRLAKRGEILPRKIGRRVTYFASELRRFAAGRTH